MADIDLDKVDALGDFLTDECYDVQFVTIPNSISGLTADEINLRVKSIEIPDRPVIYVDIMHRTFSKKQPAKRENIQSVTLSMIETMTPKTMPFLRDWQNACAMNGTNYVNLPEDRQCEVMIYHKRNNREVAYVYNLKHCQIETKGNVSLGDGGSVNPINLSITLNSNKILEGVDANHLA